MARSLRYVPPGSLVEVSCRTLHGRFLLRPCRDLNEIVLGILGRATRRYRVGLCAFAYLSKALSTWRLAGEVGLESEAGSE